MEQEDMVLNLHGECPSKGDGTIWNAESEFLPILATPSQSFPRLRICLEHLTAAEAIETIKKPWRTRGRHHISPSPSPDHGRLGRTPNELLQTCGQDTR